MKIALLHYASPPIIGGVESVLAQHARLMTKAGHTVTILAGRGEIFDERIPVRIIPMLDSRNAEVLAVKRELDQSQYTPSFDRLQNQIQQELLPEFQKFDILIAHNIASLHKNLALTAALHAAHQLPGFPPLVLWHHDLAWTTPRYHSEMHAGFPWDLLRRDWGNVTHVVVSEVRREELANLLGIDRGGIRVIPNGVDTHVFFKLEPQTIRLIEQLGLLEADPLLLLPVRLTPRKNIELALSVLEELRKQFPKAMLLVTGPEGPHNPANAAYRMHLLALRDELKLQNAAHFLAEVTAEPIPDTVMADFYRLSDALILPSLEEGFGIPLIEAAFSSLPVFCSDIPVLRELCGRDANYFDPGADPHSIARMIFDELQSETASRWRRRAKHAFSWDSIYTYHIGPLIEELAR